MKISKHVVKSLSSAGKQIFGSMGFWRYEPDKRVIRFGNKFYEAAKRHGISEADALDVYYHGYSLEQGKLFRKYNGYEIGIFYWIASDTGVIVITYCWKKLRR
jgi:hypothetical protein